MISIYIDCNILIDWLLKREPYSFYAAKIIELTENKKVKSYLSVLTLANTHYIISKELNKKIADEFLVDSLKLFDFVDITGEIIRKAIINKSKDFEDDLHYYTAIDQPIDYIITRNKKDFPKDKIKIVDLEEFIESNILEI